MRPTPKNGMLSEIDQKFPSFGMFRFFSSATKAAE
jgi:hypothetical protein